MTSHLKQQQEQNQKHSNKPAEEMMKNLKLDSFMQLNDSNTVASKDGSSSDTISCISSAGEAMDGAGETHIKHESLATDRGILPCPVAAPATSAYYYPGYDATFGGLDDQGYVMHGDAMDLQYPVLQADNGSLMYFPPGIHTGYNPYGSFLPITMVGADGMYVGQQPYPPSSMFQTSVSSHGYIPSLPSYGELLPSPYMWDGSIYLGGAPHWSGYNGILETQGSKTRMPLPTHKHSPSSRKIVQPDISNQLKPASKNVPTFQSDPLGKEYFQSAKLPSYSQEKGGMLYQNNLYKSSIRSWTTVQKPKSRSNIKNINDFDLPTEHNQGTDRKGSLTFGANGSGALATDESRNCDNATPVIRRDQYNLPASPITDNHAFFFVIKSYSEDDIHKSIKYNVWASTPNGNKRLDGAYQDAQKKMAEMGSNYPVFLFFSVNASGQFCGVAEMIGRVDFNKNMDFWQQDKWNGCFPVKWHIIKDVPNPQLRHIILENNENKPVTNSRDTQEVRFPQGIEMLKIFKNYVSKTSILDDFEFYESRQKVMQEKKLRSYAAHVDYKQKTDDLANQLQTVDISTDSNRGET